jgi:hypothetical protein
MMADYRPFQGIATEAKQSVANDLFASLFATMSGTVQTSLTGAADGEYADVDIMAGLLNTAGELALNVNLRNPAKQDAQGAGIASDTPVKIEWLNGAVGPGPLIDTQGYNAIVMSFAAAQGTYLFQTSHDPQQLTATLANAGGWPTSGAGVVTATVVAAAGATYVVPTSGRYFRPYCSVAGTQALMTIYLRAAPVSFLSNSTVVTGNIAVGAAATASPLAVGAVDQAGLTRRFMSDPNGYLSMGGPIKAGWQFGIFNAQYNQVGTLVASATPAQSTFNPVIMGGLDKNNTARMILTDPQGAQIVSFAATNAEDFTVPELLQQMVAAQYATVDLLSQLVAAMYGRNSPLPSEEADTLIAENINRLYNKLNNFNQ